MIEPPSKSLVALLYELRLCSARDLRRCRSRVRQLTRDLPTFDSIWIDALVQQQCLTPFQARVLESGLPQRLRMGPCVLVDELSFGRDCFRTVLARHRETREPCVLKFIEPGAEQNSDVIEGLRGVIQDIGRIRHPGLAAPTACLEVDGRIVIVSRYVPGIDLRDLMVRRGRFNPVRVSEIGRQIIETLSHLERAGATHGDLRLSKVRLTAEGRIVLVDTGYRSRSNPWQVIHETRQADECDFVAPERIGEARDADARSDMYSLGCLLWQLLAGRPPFPAGDPLAKLAAHQTRHVPDIRTTAPETPEALAAAINLLVQHDRRQRPASFRGLGVQWGGFRSSGRRTLSGFQKTVPQESSLLPPRQIMHRGRPRWAFIGLLLFLFSGLSLSLIDHGARLTLLNFAGNAVRDLLASSGLQEQDAEATNSLQETSGDRLIERPRSERSGAAFPLPDSSGQVLLESGISYPTVAFDHDQRIVLKANGSKPARIIVGETPLRLSAPVIELENIEIVHDSSASALPTSGAMLLIRSDSLTTRNVHVDFRPEPHLAETGSPSPRPVALAWKRMASNRQSKHRVVFENCVFHGPLTAAYFSDHPDEIQWKNCLQVSGGTLANVPHPVGDSPLNIYFEQVTVRGTETLLRIRGMQQPVPFAELQLDCHRCCFDLNETGSLFEWLPRAAGPSDPPMISVAGSDSVSREGIEVLTIDAENLPGFSTDDVVSIEGIVSSPLRYRGPASADPADSLLVELGSFPRLASGSDDDPGLPGIDTRRFLDRSTIGAGPMRSGQSLR